MGLLAQALCPIGSIDILPSLDGEGHVDTPAIEKFSDILKWQVDRGLVHIIIYRDICDKQYKLMIYK